MTEGTRSADYQPRRLPFTGGLNVDMESLTPEQDFVELHNLRKTAIDGYEIRSGYDNIPSAVAGYPEFKCEYIVRNEDKALTFKYDTTVYNDPATGEVRIQFIDKETLTIVQDMVVVQDASFVGNPPVCVCGQSLFAVIVSVYKYRTYIVYPDAFDALSPFKPTSWKVESLLPGQSIHPKFIAYEQEIEGDLILFEHDNVTNATHDKWGFRVSVGFTLTSRELRIVDDFTEPTQFVDGQVKSKIRIACKSPYFLRDGTPDVFGSAPIKRWVGPPEDTTPVAPWDASQTKVHMQTNGWLYRLVYVIRKEDANGNSYEFRAQASSDFWVRDSIYGPPQLFVEKDGAITGRPTMIGIKQAEDLDDDNLRSFYTNYPQPNYDKDGNDDGTVEAYPSSDAMEKLMRRLIEYYDTDMKYDPNFFTNPANAVWKSEASGGNFPGGGLIAYWAAFWAGFRNVRDTTPGDFGQSTILTSYDGNAPYWCDVPVSYLKGAPMAKFTWDQFIFDDPNTDVVAIEFYRTAYNCPDTNDNKRLSPLFGQHRYGYVGTLSKNEDAVDADNSFVDDVPDDQIDFANTPSQYDLYFGDQLTGQVYTEYNSFAVLGNLATRTKTLSPANSNPTHSSLWYESTDGLGVTTASFPYIDGTDGWRVMIQYVDIDNKRSNAVIYGLNPNIEGYNAAANNKIAITLPMGYAPSVSRINIYLAKIDIIGLLALLGTDPTSVYTGGAAMNALVSDAYLVDTVNTATRYYTIEDDPTQQVFDLSSLGEDITNIVQPGAIVRSDSNNPFQWQPITTEVLHNSNSVTFMEVLAGRLWVLTDGSIHMTQLDGQRREPENNRLGCISRHGAVKVDLVIYTLTGDGLYYIDASGPKKLPLTIESAITPYLQERVSGELPLWNVRRCSMGYLGQRNEIWLHIPASGTTGGINSGPASEIYQGTPLTHKTFILRVPDSYNPAGATVSTFDISEDFDTQGLPANNRTNRVIFGTHADGTMWASHAPQGSLLTMQNLNCDNPASQWNVRTVMSKALIFGDPSVVKFIRKITLTMQARSTFHLLMGIPRIDGSYKYQDGYINSALANTYTFAMDSPIGGGYSTGDHVPPYLYERQGKILYLRITSEPNGDGIHEVKYKNLIAYTFINHNHV